jgi:hypothetical protein
MTSAATTTVTTVLTTIVVEVVVVGAIRRRLRSGWISRLQGRATGSQECHLCSALGVSLSGGLLTQDKFARLNEAGEFWKERQQSFENTELRVQASD